MGTIDIPNALADISATRNLLERSLKLTGLISTIFHAKGYNLVVVGGAAIEFYTEGDYMSGDIDLCRTNAAPIPLKQQQTLLGELQATGGPRSFKICNLFIDLLGFLENEAHTPFQKVESPYGIITLVPPEMLLIERVLVAAYPQPDQHSRQCAKTLLSAMVSGRIGAIDWDEVTRLASDPRYDILDEVHALKLEVERER
jgi:hypothetical protein